MKTILIILAVVGFGLHVWRGNYWYPLKEGIVKHPEYEMYCLYKWHLFLGVIPIKLWLGFPKSSGIINYIGTFVFKRVDSDGFYSLDRAIMSLTKSRKANAKKNSKDYIEVYNTGQGQIRLAEMEEYKNWLKIRDKVDAVDDLLHLEDIGSKVNSALIKKDPREKPKMTPTVISEANYFVGNRNYYCTINPYSTCRSLSTIPPSIPRNSAD